MLKQFFLVLGLLTFALNLNAQRSTSNPFAGKVFTIDNYIDGKFDNTEDLTFTITHVEGSICIQYGFEKTKYTVKQNKAGLWEFSCTMLSKEHGKMVWVGEKNNNTISGKYLWTKEGQAPINYTFKGKLK